MNFEDIVKAKSTARMFKKKTADMSLKRRASADKGQRISFGEGEVDMVEETATTLPGIVDS